MKEYIEKYRAVCDRIDVSSSFSEKTAERILADSRLQKSASMARPKKLIVLLVAVLAVILFAGTVYAVGAIRMARISNNAEFSAKADILAVKVDQSAEVNGITLTLSEAVYENGRLYMLFNLQHNEEDIRNASVIPQTGTFKIDHKEPLNITYTSTCQTDGNILWITNEYDLSASENFSGSHDFSITIDCLDIMRNDGTCETIAGPWVYNFTLDVSALNSQTSIYKIDQEIMLSNGDIICIEEIICTPISQRIFYRVVNADGNRITTYCIDAAAIDSLGNRYEFTFSNASLGKESALECYSVNLLPDNFSADAGSIIIQSLTVRDREGNILLTLDEPITANRSYE